MITGGIMTYAKADIPTGFLLCDGSAVSRTTYATLFGVIGTLYGIGNGSTTFNIPDYGGRIAMGLSGGDSDFGTLGQSGGAKTIDLSHTHVTTHTHAAPTGSAVATTNNYGTTDTSPNESAGSTLAHPHTISAATISTASVTTSSSGSATQSILNKSRTFYCLIKT